MSSAKLWLFHPDEVGTFEFMLDDPHHVIVGDDVMDVVIEENYLIKVENSYGRWWYSCVGEWFDYDTFERIDVPLVYRYRTQ